MKEQLFFGVLGPLEVRRGEQVLDVPRRKERQLIAALLLDANRPVTTDLLIERLWHEDAPAKPLTSLRACVSNVRKALAGPEDDQPLVTDRGGYLLHVSSSALDSLAFEELVSAARQAMSSGSPAETARLLDEALGLVRGEPLSDMAYDEFIQHEVSRLAELINSAYELRAQVAVELGEAAAWLPRISELIAAHPLREQLQATRMLALYQVGRQADALRCYADHRQAMIDELGIEPSPELQDLEARILAQDDTLLPKAAPPEPERLATAGPETAVPVSADSPAGASLDGGLQIVGRAAELELLAELAEHPPGHAFVIGESGSGKSTVVDGFMRQLASSGWRTAQALCPDDDGVPPLWPWRQVLRDLDLGELAAAPTNQAISRFEYLDDVASGLIQAAAHSPIAIFVDDLQWADQDTLKLVGHLARRARTERLLMIGAARAVPPELSGLAATWIELQNFTVDDVVDLIQQLTGEEGDRDLASDLCERTGGNAYFVTELIEFARRFGSEVRGDVEIPSHVRGLVEQRINLLPEPTKQVLEFAALELQNFSVDVLASALDQSVEQVRADLQPALAGGVVVSANEGFERFRFDHAIARETVADGLDPAIRIRRHADLGRAIEAVAGHDAELHATHLSRHYAIGAPSGTAEQAVAWAEFATAKAVETWSYRDAIVHINRALTAHQYLDRPERVRRCRTLLQLVLASKITGDVATADEALLEASQLSTQEGDPLLLSEVALAMSEGVGEAHWRWYWTPVSSAVSNLRDVLNSLDPGDSAMKVSLMIQLVSDGYADLSGGDRTSLLAEATSMAERIGEPSLISRVLHARRTIEGWAWEPEEALRYDRQLLARYRSEGVDHQAQQILGMIIVDLLTSGDLSGAKQALREIEDQVRIRGSLTWRYCANSWQVLFAQLAGDWGLANQLSFEALDPVTGLGQDLADSVLNQQLITWYLQGEFDQVLPVIELAAGVSRRPLLTRSLLNSYAISGRIDEAHALLETLDPAQPDIDAVGGRFAVAMAAEALAILGLPEPLGPLVEFVRPAAGRLCLGNPGLGGLVFQGPFRYHLAMGLVALGQFDEAAHHIELGRQGMSALKAKPQLIRFDLVEAFLRYRRDGKAAARGLFEEVQAAATDGGMFGVVGLAERLLAE